MFKYDGPFFTVLSRALDIIILNVLWMICCLPVVTIGPATAALYGVYFKVKEKKDYNVFTQFFQEFRDNFKQGFLASLVFIAAALLLYVDYRVVFFDETFSMTFLQGLFWVVLAVAVAYFSWLFPLIAKFENTFGGMLKNARVMLVRHLPLTAVITALNSLPWLLLYFFPALTLQNMLLFWLLMGFGLITYINSIFLYNCFFHYFDQAYIDKLKKAQEDLSK